jgi:hypothetical protein
MLTSRRKKSVSIDFVAEKFAVQVVLETKHTSKSLFRQTAPYMNL